MNMTYEKKLIYGIMWLALFLITSVIIINDTFISQLILNREILPALKNISIMCLAKFLKN